MILLLLVALLLLLLLAASAISWEALHPPRRTSGWAVARHLPIDPGEVGLPYREWTLDRPDGAELPVWEIDFSGGAEPGGCTLVMLHGWARSRIDSLDRLLAVRGAVPASIRRAVLVDLRGHGDASGPGCRLGSREIGDTLALLERLDDERIVLGGHSMGAVIAIAAAAAASPTLRTRLTGLIAWAPYRSLAAPIGNRLRFRGVPAWPLTTLALWMMAPLLRVPAGHGGDTADRAAEVALPLLIFAAAKDTVAPPADAATIAERGNATLVLLPNAAHGDIHNADPQRHAEALRDWFAQHLAPACTAPGER